MHVPDGFINAPVSVAAGVAAAGAVALSLRGARRELGGDRDGAAHPGAAGVTAERTAPLAGLVAAFIFAVQMLNFPVAAGTSGHLLGGALAAILVGPFTGMLCVAVVLLMQAVLFADGGLTALGVNILIMGVVTVLVAYGVLRALLLVLPRGRGAVTGASFAAALISVPASAIAFTGLYALGGTADVELGRVLAAMTGVHVLIGIGEAVITAATVGAVIAVRPDLVHGARELASGPLQLRTSPVAAPGETAAQPRPEQGAVARPASAPEGERQPAAAAAGESATAAAPRSNRGMWLGGLAATLLCAGVVSFYASSSPDGLESVAADNGIDEKAEDHAAEDSPLADYGIEAVTDTRLSGGLAGVVGVGATLAVGSGIFVAVRRRRAEGTAEDASSLPDPAPAARTPGTSPHDDDQRTG